MIRHPVQRVISGWFDDKHDCRGAATIGVYAKCVKSCAAQMILGSPCGASLPDGEPDLFAHEPSEAVDRIRKFGFVGITEEWELSVCLFHAMFGGDCLPVEFPKDRAGTALKAKTGLYDPEAVGLEDRKSVV